MSRISATPALPVVQNLVKLANKTRAAASLRFFKTGKGEYAEGDQFIGVSQPQLRDLALTSKDSLSLEECSNICQSPFNEQRALGLLVLTAKAESSSKIIAKDKASKNKKKKTKEKAASKSKTAAKKKKQSGGEDDVTAEAAKAVQLVEQANAQREKILKLYIALAEANKVNNWNLVDLSAPIIVKFGIESETEKKRVKQLLEWAQKWGNLWVRRIAVVGCQKFIFDGHFKEIFAVAKYLIQKKESHDLMHKATGWMLREVGRKGGEQQLKDFLDLHVKSMPATMLSYATERMSEADRKKYRDARKN